MSRNVCCTYHCATCHSHFSSLGAFDAHRIGDYETGRYCEEPLDVAELAAKTETGVCEIGRDEVRIGVPVYALARDLENWSQKGPSEHVLKPQEATEVAA